MKEDGYGFEIFEKFNKNGAINLKDFKNVCKNKLEMSTGRSFIEMVEYL